MHRRAGLISAVLSHAATAGMYPVYSSLKLEGLGDGMLNAS
jgi:hypothetical protein